MTFDNLIDIKPNVSLDDLIQLFLLGMDDKTYFGIQLDDVKFDHVRIIDPWLKPYYEYRVKYIEKSDYDSRSIFSVRLVKENWYLFIWILLISRNFHII